MDPFEGKIPLIDTVSQNKRNAIKNMKLDVNFENSVLRSYELPLEGYSLRQSFRSFFCLPAQKALKLLGSKGLKFLLNI